MKRRLDVIPTARARRALLAALVDAHEETLMTGVPLPFGPSVLGESLRASEGKLPAERESPSPEPIERRLVA